MAVVVVAVALWVTEQVPVIHNDISRACDRLFLNFSVFVSQNP